MIETYFRDWYQKYFVDKVALCIAPWCSANTVTFLGLMFGLFVPYCLLLSPLLASSCLLISGYLDTLDGTVARFRNESSPIGSVFDIVFDRIVEFSAVLGLFLVDPQRGFYIICMLGSILICITSFLVVGIFTEKSGEKSFFYSVGLMERAEAFAFFIAMMFFPNWFNILALVFTSLVFLSAGGHLYKFVKYSKKCSVT